MMTVPKTEVSTGTDKRAPAGRCWVRDLYDSVWPIKIESGIKMKRSMYKN